MPINSAPYPGTPRWVKISALIAGILVLLFLALRHSRGNHGPGLHGLLGGRSSHGEASASGHPQ
jgi:hypothetical protein